MGVKVVLDESKFGNTSCDKTMPLYGFYRIKKNGIEEFITARNCDGTTLIAVTKAQYKQWKSYNLTSRKIEATNDK